MKNKIIKWLYTNDGGFKSNVEWRQAFIKFLDGLENATEEEKAWNDFITKGYGVLHSKTFHIPVDEWLNKGHLVSVEPYKQNTQLKQDKNWRAKKHNYYNYIDDWGKLDNTFDSNHRSDEYHYNTLNYFQTQEQAEAYQDYQLAVGRVSRAIWEANGDWKEVSDDRQQGKYQIFYYDWSGKMGVELINNGIVYPYVIPCIKSMNIAEQIIKDYEEDLMTIFNYKR